MPSAIDGYAETSEAEGLESNAPVIVAAGINKVCC